MKKADRIRFEPAVYASAKETPHTKRVRVTQEAVDRYSGRQMALGKVDCFRPVAHVLRKAGYKVPLAKAGSYSSLAGALRALKTLGYANLPELMDGLGLERIGHASALPGDILALPGEDNGWLSLALYIGNGRSLGFSDMDGVATCGVGDALEIEAAWRVNFG